VALVVGDWRFPAGSAPPPLPQLATALADGMGLEVLVEGGGRDAGLHVPRLGERLFDWHAEPGRLRVHGFAPAHPFLWEHLDAVLGEAGAHPAEGATVWRPDPRHRPLRRAWSSLTRREQWILRLPSVLASRPQDRFLQMPGR
jgi:hypothetical protein